MSANFATNCPFELPQIRLGKFDGDPLKFRHFFQLFDICIGNQNIPNDIKLIYLFDSLTGQAARAVEGYDVTEESYQFVRERLQRRFGNTRLIRTRLLQRFLSIEKPSEKFEDGVAFVDDIEALLRQAEAMGIDIESDFVQFAIERALPEWMKSIIITMKCEESNWNTQRFRTVLARIIELKAEKELITSRNFRRSPRRQKKFFNDQRKNMGIPTIKLKMDMLQKKLKDNEARFYEVKLQSSGLEEQMGHQDVVFPMIEIGNGEIRLQKDVLPKIDLNKLVGLQDLTLPKIEIKNGMGKKVVLSKNDLKKEIRPKKMMLPKMELLNEEIEIDHEEMGLQEMLKEMRLQDEEVVLPKNDFKEMRLMVPRIKNKKRLQEEIVLEIKGEQRIQGQGQQVQWYRVQRQRAQWDQDQGQQWQRAQGQQPSQ